jgi:adenylate cyclase class 2
MIEREIKLRFSDVESARAAVVRAGGRLIHPRRLIDDRLFDSADGRMVKQGTSLRLRRDGGQLRLTVKGPPLPGPVKSREEFETTVADEDTVERMLAILGYVPVFRSQKYREDHAVGDVHVSIDEPPFGVFLEVEGPEAEIHRVSRLLGRTPADYRLESYMALWRQHCLERGLQPADMTFANAAGG